MSQKVSIIIPTYKRCDMLERAINSVINQSYKNIEIIVVDDNDENSEYRKNTEIIMSKFNDYENIIYLKHKRNRNGSVARNTGIARANGKYIGFLDDDDEFLPQKIEKQIECLNKVDESYGAVYGGFCIIRGEKNISEVKPIKEGILTKELLLMEWGTGSGSNIIFKKDILKELNGFDESLLRHQDWDVLLRMFRKYKLAVVDETLLNIYKDSRINIPNADVFVNVKKYCNEKFKADILKFDNYIQSKIKSKHLLELSIAYCKNKKYKQAYKYYKKSNKIFKTGFKEKIILILVCIYINLPYKEKILITFGKIIENIRFIKA